MVFVTRRERFNAAHRLFIPEWDDEKNMKIFGKCSNPNWHGHNYELFVTVKAEPDPITGFVINLKDLSLIINEKIIQYCDHKNLNTEVPFMKGIQPTAENIAVAIWNELQSPIEKNKGVFLHCVKVSETENNVATYYGKRE